MRWQCGRVVVEDVQLSDGQPIEVERFELLARASTADGLNEKDWTREFVAALWQNGGFESIAELHNRQLEHLPFRTPLGAVDVVLVDHYFGLPFGLWLTMVESFDAIKRIKPHYGIEPTCGSSDSSIRANFPRQDKGGDLLLNQSCLCSQLFL